MQKVLLMSVLVATMVIPIRNARNPRLARPLRRTVIQMFAFLFFWIMGLKYLYWHLPK